MFSNEQMIQVLTRMNSLERRVDRLARREGMSVTDPGVALPLTISLIQALPALRGFWPASSQSRATAGNYDLVDISGNGQHFIHTANPRINFDTTGLFSYVEFDGANEWYSIADTNHWDILGTEGGVAAARRGLTLFAWVYYNNTASAAEYILSKWYGAGERSYFLYRDSSGYPGFGISDDGSADDSIVGTVAIASGGWHLVAGRFEPSAEVAVFDNGTWYTNTTSIPASIYNGAADLFMAGRDDGATPGLFLMDGSIALAGSLAAHVPDAAIDRIWNVSRHIFGV